MVEGGAAPAGARRQIVVAIYADADGYPPTYNACVLLAEEFDVHLVCVGPGKGLRWPAGVCVERVEVTAVGPLGKARAFARFGAAIRRAVTHSRSRVALAYDPHAFVAMTIARPAIPVVYQRHEVENFDRRLGVSLGAAALLAARPLSRRADLVIFPQLERAEYYAQHVGLPSRPMIVPNYPLRESFDFAFDWSSLIERRLRKPRALYRGLIGSGNGVLSLIDAMAFVNPAVSADIIGYGPAAETRAVDGRIALRGLSSRVTVRGFIPFSALNEMAVECAVGVLPYRAVDVNWEHCSTAANKTYEYAACGLPVVVPDRPSFRRALGEESWIEFADPERPATIAKAIERILGDADSYAGRCRAAREAFASKYHYAVAFAPAFARIRELAEAANVHATPVGGSASSGGARP